MTISKFLTAIYRKDFTESKQIYTFMNWCAACHFLDNLTADDMESCLSEDGIHLPLLKSRNITIAISIYDEDFARVGIDPSSCFDRISTCSIQVSFPFETEAKEKDFYSTLAAVFADPAIFDQWEKDAPIMFEGEFFTNRK